MKLNRRKKIAWLIVGFLFLLIFFNPSPMNVDWRTASRESANIAPLPHVEHAAQVQIYSAKAFSWRGKFSVHTWIATKEKDAAQYQVYHVVMWGMRDGRGVVSVSEDIPDRCWYGACPEIIFSASGEKAEMMIPQIYEAVKSYPYPNYYQAYPGPNSNSFTSYVMREVPGFNIALPTNAIGKDWLCCGKFFSITESRTGFQFSLYGMFGFTIGLIEGVEFNVIGFSFGIDFIRPALKLPIIGRVGFRSNAFF